MAVLTLRPWIHRGLAVALAATAVSAAHAASLGVSTDDLSAWTLVTDVPVATVPVCGEGGKTTPCVVPFGTTVTHVNVDADVLILGTVEKKVIVKDGTVTVGSTGIVGSDIDQKRAGGVIVKSNGQVHGQIKESGDGSVVVSGIVVGNVEEQDAGDIVLDGATIGGTVTENNAGHLTISGLSTIGGSAIERNNGDLTIGPSVTVGLNADSTPGGVCVIDPGATILGARKNLCT